MKRILTTVLVAVTGTVILLTGCKGNTGQTENGTDSAVEVSKDKIKGRTLILAHGQPVDSIADLSMQQLSQNLLEQTNESVRIEVFPAVQLGNERDLVEGLSLGTIDMAWISGAVMENFEPRFSIFSMPYMFKNYDHVHKLTQGELGQEIFEELRVKHGIRVLGFYDQGFRYVWNNVHPITRLEDFKGIKMRVPESPIYVSTFTKLGTNATSLPWGELYTALQTGVVDGYEVFPESTVANQMYEVTKYGSVTNHIYAGAVLMINEEKYQSLTEEQKRSLQEAAGKSVDYNNQELVNNEAEYIRKLEDEGMEINTLSDEEMKRMAEVVTPIYEENQDKVGGLDFINQVKALVE